VSEEREIYEASPKRSVINKVRAPFYRVLDLDDATLKEVSQVVPMDQWVVALFNVSRPERKRLVDQFSEKQRFLFMEMMKRMDAQSPERTRVGMMRERIAQTVVQYLARKSAETQSTQTSEAQGDDVAKAA
jgi:flagellar motor switch protein FliG